MFSVVEIPCRRRHAGHLFVESMPHLLSIEWRDLVVISGETKTMTFLYTALADLREWEGDEMENVEKKRHVKCTCVAGPLVI